jgi:biopolymer transport protein TolR
MNQINVVPYIDVMLVLLVIFMVTAPLIQTGSIELPSVGQAAAPPVQPLEVVIRGNGAIAMRDRAGSGAERAVARGELGRMIREAQARNPRQAVLIAADRSVRYEAVMQVMDELQRQQVARIGLLVQPGK